MQVGFSGSSKNAVFDPDPRAKLSMLLAVNIIMISGGAAGVELVLRAVCAALPFLLLLSIRHYRAAVIYFILLGAAVYCEGFVLPYTHGAASILLMIPCGILTRLTAGYMMCWYCVKSVSVSEFVTAMEKMHTPYFITIPLSVMFRYFPTLGEEYLQSIVTGYGQEYVDALSSFTPAWMFYVMAAMCIVGGFIGGLLGAAVLKKHFRKAGMA